MFAKRQRLTRQQFLEYFKAGRRFHTPYFQVIYTPHEHRHASVVVGKKVTKKAVDRNRLRRQIYARLRHLLLSQEMTGVYILITKPPVATLTKAALTEAVAAAIGLTSKKR